MASAVARLYGIWGLSPSGVQVQSPGRGSGTQSPPTPSESGENFAHSLNWCFELNNYSLCILFGQYQWFIH